MGDFLRSLSQKQSDWGEPLGEKHSEDGGFEPPLHLRVNTLSKGARSTALPTFHDWDDREMEQKNNLLIYIGKHNISGQMSQKKKTW